MLELLRDCCVGVHFETCGILQDTGHYAPGIRFILELMPFLRETFGDDDIFKCPVCSALVIRVSMILC